jgi:hypothetical protein
MGRSHIWWKSSWTSSLLRFDDQQKPIKLLLSRRGTCTRNLNRDSEAAQYISNHVRTGVVDAIFWPSLLFPLTGKECRCSLRTPKRGGRSLIWLLIATDCLNLHYFGLASASVWLVRVPISEPIERDLFGIYVHIHTNSQLSFAFTRNAAVGFQGQAICPKPWEYETISKARIVSESCCFVIDNRNGLLLSAILTPHVSFFY